jgi:hypothetical protein
MLLRHYRVHGEADAGIHCVGNRGHAVAVHPLADNLRPDIRFVEMIRRHDLHLQTTAGGGEVIRRHVCRDDRATPGLVGERAVHVVENADLDGIGQFRPGGSA